MLVLNQPPLPIGLSRRLCERGDSNPHGLSTTSTSSWRGYHYATFAELQSIGSPQLPHHMWMPFIFGTDIFLQLGQKAFAFFVSCFSLIAIVFFFGIKLKLQRNQGDLNPRSPA